MNEHNDNLILKKIHDTVLHQVETGSLRVHSRRFFMIRFAATVAVAVLAFLFSTLVMSFIFFSIHESGEQFLLGFGGAGVLTFLELFPWVAFVVDIALLVLLEWLLQGFKLGYRVSLIVIFIGIFGGSAVLGFLIDLTPLHSTLLGLANKGELPIVGGVYESLRDNHAAQGVFRGMVVAVSEHSIIIAHEDNDRDGDDGVWNVQVPLGSGPFHVGERVYVFGLLASSTIEAQGIQLLSSN